MEARTTSQKTIIVLGCAQAIVAATVVATQDFETVRISHIETWFSNGWKLPGTILAGILSLSISLLVLFTEPRAKPIQALLKCLGDTVFDRKKLDTSVLTHKITYFALRPRQNFFGVGKILRRWLGDRAESKLVPRYRYPFTARKPRRAFRVDKGDTSLCEGVAGLVFIAGPGAFISATELPRLSSSSTSDELQRFAQLTNDRYKQVRAHGHFDIRSIGGFQILAPDDSQIVGVLMFDSSEPTLVDTIPAKPTVQYFLKAFSRTVAS